MFEPTRRPKSIDPLVLGGLFVVALLVCLFRIGAKDLWLDEALSLNVTNSWAELPQRFEEVRGASWLYYVVLRAWRALFETDAQLRALSAVFGAGAVALTYVLGARLVSRLVGVFAAILLLVNYAFMYHAQEVRMYTLAIFLVCANGVAVLSALRRSDYGPWVLAGVIAGLCYGVHYFSIFAWGAQFFGALLLWRHHVNWRGALATVAVATASIGAQLLAFNPAAGSPTLNFVPLPGLNEIYGLFATIGGDGWKRVVLFYVIAFIAVGFAVARRKEQAQPLGSTAIMLWLLGWIAAPIAALLLLSYVATPVFVFRYMMTIVPAMALLIAYGMASARPRPLAFVLLLGALAAQGRAVQEWYFGQPLEQWRAAADHYRANADPREPVVMFQFYVEAPFRRYAGLETTAGLGVPALLEETDLVYVWRDGAASLVKFENLAGVLSDAPSFWLILSHDLADRISGEATRGRLLDALADYVAGDEKQLKGVRVLHMERTSALATNVGSQE